MPNVDAVTRYPQDSLGGTVTILGDVVGPVLPASAWSAVRGELLVAHSPQKAAPQKAAKAAKKPRHRP